METGEARPLRWEDARMVQNRASTLALLMMHLPTVRAALASFRPRSLEFQMVLAEQLLGGFWEAMDTLQLEDHTAFESWIAP